MRHQSGFTLVEIVVVIAILGILGATAVPVFRTWQMRARGTEAAVMARQILDAQIVYYMEHDEFYPPGGETIEIYHNDAPDSQNVQDVAKYLNIMVPTGHFLNYNFMPDNEPGNEQFVLQISSETKLKIFKEGYLVIYTINKKGEMPEPTYY